MRLKARLSLYLVFILILLPFPVAASQLVLTDDAQPISLNGFLSVYEDPSASETIRDIMIKAKQGAFSPLDAGYSGGYRASRVWFRVDLRSASKTTDWVLTLGVPFLNEVDLYRPKPDGTIHHARQGEMAPPAQRDMMTRGPAFKITLAPMESTTLYISVKSQGTLAVTGTIRTKEEFNKFEKYDTFIIAALCSASIFLLVFSLANTLFSGSYLSIGPVDKLDSQIG